VQSTGTNRGGFYIDSSSIYPGLYLKGQNITNNDNDEYVYSQYIVNSRSVNLIPFSQIRVTFEPQYGYASDGVGGECRIYLMNTSKKLLKTSSYVRAGFSYDATVILDVSAVNEHAFFRIEAKSVVGASYGDCIIKKIEFIK
jgi:hypothetical protein